MEIEEIKCSVCPHKQHKISVEEAHQQGRAELIDENMIKGLYCVASYDTEGGCYADHENNKHLNDENWKRMVCGTNSIDYVSGKGAQPCPYHQTVYGTCFEEGELHWLKELADKLKAGGAE